MLVLLIAWLLGANCGRCGQTVLQTLSMYSDTYRYTCTQLYQLKPGDKSALLENDLYKHIVTCGCAKNPPTRRGTTSGKNRIYKVNVLMRDKGVSHKETPGVDYANLAAFN